MTRPTSFAQVEKGYAKLWAEMVVRPERLAAARAVATRINANRARYEKVAAVVGCPWWFVGVVHNLEGGASFQTHLHNGQSLLRRTTAVPAGRPPASVGDPPFTWEVSAVDALRYQKIDKVPSWSIPRLLWEWELWNGLGYYGRINSPYLWSFSNLYERGKFESDGRYVATLVSQQCGAAVALRAMIDMGYVSDVEPKGTTAMNELQAIVQALGKNAPTLAASFGGPLAGLAVKILADAAGAKDSEPQSVVDKLHDLATNIPALLGVLTDAEEKITTIAPPSPAPAPSTTITPTWTTPADPVATQPQVIVVQQPTAPAPQVIAQPVPAPVVVAPTMPLPKASTGPLSFLDGYKTYIGIAITAAGFILFNLHYVTADISNIIVSVGAAIGGAGLVDKWQKARAVLPFIPALPGQPSPISTVG